MGSDFAQILQPSGHLCPQQTGEVGRASLVLPGCLHLGQVRGLPVFSLNGQVPPRYRSLVCALFAGASTAGQGSVPRAASKAAGITEEPPLPPTTLLAHTPLRPRGGCTASPCPPHLRFPNLASCLRRAPGASASPGRHLLQVGAWWESRGRTLASATPLLLPA